jgi:hypothetical protein
MPQPTAPEAASPLVSTQKPFQDLSKLVQKNDSPLLLFFDINALAAGQSLVFYSDGGVPDYWRVSIRPGAGIRVSVYPGPQISGIPIRLGGGGKLKLPIPLEYLSVLVEGGSNAASGTVVAVRKYPDFDLDSGDVA